MAINPQINDMPWFGKPADPVGAYQQGQNLAEQSQRMSQSRDMHPLRMEAASASTNLLQQQGEYNRKSMDSRVGIAASMDSLKQSEAFVAAGSKDAKVQLNNLLASKAEFENRLRTTNESILTKAQAATAQGMITKSEIGVATAQASIEQKIADAAVAKGSVKYNIEKNRLNNLYTLGAINTNTHNLSQAMVRANQEAESKGVFEYQMGQLEAAFTEGSEGSHSFINDFFPDERLTEPQRRILKERQTAMKKDSAVAAAYIKGQAADALTIDNQRSATTVWSDINSENPRNAEFIREKYLIDGNWSSEGMAVMKRYTEGVAVRKLIGEDNWAAMTSNDVATQAHAGYGYAGQKAATRSIRELDGDLIIPSREALAAMQKKATEMKAASHAGDVITEKKFIDKFGTQITSVGGGKVTLDKQKEVRDGLIELMTSQAWLDLGPEGKGAELGRMLSALDVADGSIRTVHGAAGVQQLVASGQAKEGDLVLDLITGQFAPVSKAGTPTQEQGKGNKAYQESSADDEFKERAKPPSPPSSKKLVGTPYLVDRLKKGNRRWTSFDKKMLHNAGWNPDTGERLRAAGGSTKAKPTIKEATPKAEGLPNQYDTGPLRDLGISATDPSMDDITLRSASQRLRLGIPLNQEEINALTNRHPIPKEMPAENIRVINAARRGEKLPPQDKEWLKEMNIDPETGIPMGKVKIVRLPPRPTLRPKKSPPQARKNPAMETTKNISKDIKKNLEAIREKSDMNDKIIRDWENGRISSEEMRKRLGIK